MTAEQHAHWESYITSPRSARMYDAIARGAINYGVTLDYIRETKHWFTSTVYFKASGPSSRVLAFCAAVQRGINSYNNS